MTDDPDIRIAHSVIDYIFRRSRWTTCPSTPAPSWAS